MCCCFACILQSGGGGLSAQIGALQQSWRANAPADFAGTEFWVGAVAVRYAHLAATAVNMRTGGGKCAFGVSEAAFRKVKVGVSNRLAERRPHSSELCRTRSRLLFLAAARVLAAEATTLRELSSVIPPSRSECVCVCVCVFAPVCAVPLGVAV